MVGVKASISGIHFKNGVAPETVSEYDATVAKRDTPPNAHAATKAVPLLFLEKKTLDPFLSKK